MPRPPLPFAAAVLALGALWAVLALASGRHEIGPPARGVPLVEGYEEADHGVRPDDVGRALARGEATVETPEGRRVVLTIDERLQKSIFDLYKRFDPPYGVCVAMEPATGRIAAMVGYRRDGESDPGLALRALYPAASLIKVVTAAAALEAGSVDADDELPYRGGIYTITRRNLHPGNTRGTRTMSLEEALAKSANTVFGPVAVDHVGRERLETYMEKFGFGQPIPFGLPVETSQGTVPEDDYGLARTGAGFGDVFVSPLHMAMIMSAIARKGEMPRPLLVDRVEDEGGDPVYEAEPSAWRTTVSPETADLLLRMMVRTVEAGTSRRTFGTAATTPLLRDMEVAGKTGSLSGWNPRMRFEWFAGVAPVNEPKLAVAALVVNSNRWRIKGSYVGKEAFSAYFGYPESNPPRYARGKGKRGKGGKKAGLRKPKGATKSPPRADAVRRGKAAKARAMSPARHGKGASRHGKGDRRAPPARG